MKITFERRFNRCGAKFWSSFSVRKPRIVFQYKLGRKLKCRDDYNSALLSEVYGRDRRIAAELSVSLIEHGFGDKFDGFRVHL